MNLNKGGKLYEKPKPHYPGAGPAADAAAGHFVGCAHPGGVCRGAYPQCAQCSVDRLEEELPNLPSNGHPVIVCCRSGQRSAIAAELLAQAGRQVYDLGSINCWDGPLTR